MKCFVAMAFGRADTDKMFEDQICGILGAKGIDAVRVDRIEHNDNIDDRIFAEIQSADFLIADLTYARPSVYFEAGFAERAIPVIYTARRDHFGHTPNDEYGVFRIHFDVATRNIIDWVDPNDQLFAQRLSSRVDHVTAPILERISYIDEVRERRKAFRAKSPRERMNDVAQAAKAALESLRYLDHDALRNNGLQGAFIFERDDWYATKVKSYSIVRLQDLDQGQSPYPSINDCEFNLNADGQIGSIERIVENWILPFTDSVEPEQLRFDSSHFRWNAEARSFAFEGKLEIPTLDRSFRGDVFLDSQRVAESFASKLWDGGEYKKGFRTKAPPMGSSHVRAEIHKEFQFVYSGFSSRSVPRVIRIHLLDDIVDGEGFKARLLALLTDG